MKKILFACFSLAFLATSCKKSDSGSGSGLSAFMTLTSGSTWNYKETNLNNNTSVNYTLAATSKDSLVNGRSYRVFTLNRNGASSSDYYNISGNTYYQFTNLIPVLPRFEFRYLVDNVPNWSDPLQQTIGNEILGQLPDIPEGTEVVISATIKNVLENGQASVSVNGIDYTNVKKVTTTLESINVSLKVSGLQIPNTVQVKQNQISSYYAPKYGLVKRETKLSLGIQVNIPGQQIPPFDIININSINELMSSSIQ